MEEVFVIIEYFGENFEDESFIERWFILVLDKKVFSSSEFSFLKSTSGVSFYLSPS